MSPPEVWGPAVWTLFHTLAEKLNPQAYPYVIPSMFNMIKRICQFLPCPDCSKDASNFLGKLKISDYKTKDEFKNMLYLFHNWVNAKKRKPLFNYSFINKYSKINLMFVVNNFIAKYNTKGNMKLLSESFQRGFVIKDFIAWFKMHYNVFVQPNITIVEEQTNVVEEPITVAEEIKEIIVEEEIKEITVAEEIKEIIVEEPINVSEEPTIVEEQTHVVEESIIIEEDPITVAEEQTNVAEEPTIVEEEPIKIEEESVIVEEQKTAVEQIKDLEIKPKKNKKSKSKK